MGSDMLLVYGLCVVAIAAVLFAVYPYLSGDIKGERRQAALQAAGRKRGGDRAVDMAGRRKQIAESLKDLEQKNTKQKLTLDMRLNQAGLTWSKPVFYGVSAAAGLAVGLLAFTVGGNSLIALAAVVVGALGLPRWFLKFKRKRRIAKFLHEFPNAVDVIVRGIKAGLPLADCVRVVATDSAEPVRSEFRRIIEAQSIGLTLSESIERIAERVPVPEANFFAIVISIQQKAGGNLSEALSNLSRVLRDRKKMKAKIKAISSEANASAMIIGAMPFVVGLLIYLTSPRYLELLWITSTGRMMVGVAAFWMSIGIAVMRKMISFEI